MYLKPSTYRTYQPWEPCQYSFQYATECSADTFLTAKGREPRDTYGVYTLPKTTGEAKNEVMGNMITKSHSKPIVVQFRDPRPLPLTVLLLIFPTHSPVTDISGPYSNSLLLGEVQLLFKESSVAALH